MKCPSCGDLVPAPLTTCPVCLPALEAAPHRLLLLRDLGSDAAFSCPECTAPLRVLELATQPVLRIERCAGGHGLFFNPGELEAILEAPTPFLPGNESEASGRCSEDADTGRDVMYRPCPVCRERMGRLNFGRRSGVVLDRCPLHGVWVTGRQLGQLADWWRAGGRIGYLDPEVERARRLEALRSQVSRSRISQVTGSSWTASDTWWPIDPLSAAASILIDTLIDGLLSL
jgi:Zn-finger nucleic acid-binding protein